MEPSRSTSGPTEIFLPDPQLNRSSFDLSYYLDFPDQATPAIVEGLLPEVFKLIANRSDEDKLKLQKFIRNLAEKLPEKIQINVYIKAAEAYPFLHKDCLAFESIWLLMKAFQISEEKKIDLAYKDILGKIDQYESDLVNHPFVINQIRLFFNIHLDEIFKSIQNDPPLFYKQLESFLKKLEKLISSGRKALASEFYMGLLTILGKKSSVVEFEKRDSLSKSISKQFKSHFDGPKTIQSPLSCKWYFYKEKFSQIRSEAKDSQEFSLSLWELLKEIFLEAYTLIGEIAPCTFDLRMLGSITRDEATFLSDVECAFMLGEEKEKREYFIRFFLPIYLGLVKFYLNCLPGILIVDPLCSHLFKRIGCDLDGSFLALILGGETIVFDPTYCEKRDISDTPLVNTPEKINKWMISELKKINSQGVPEAPYSLLFSKSLFYTGPMSLFLEEDFSKKNRSTFIAIALAHIQKFKSCKHTQKGKIKNLKKICIHPLTFLYCDLFLLFGHLPTTTVKDMFESLGNNKLLPEAFLLMLENARKSIHRIRWQLHESKQDKPNGGHYDDFSAQNSASWVIFEEGLLPSNERYSVPLMTTLDYNEVLRIEEQVLQQAYRVLEYIETFTKLIQESNSQDPPIEERMFLSAFCLLAQNKIPSSEEPRANITEEFRKSCNDSYEQAKQFFLNYVKKLAMRRLKNHSFDLNQYKKEAKACLETIGAFIPKEKERTLKVLMQVSLMEETVPSAEQLWDSSIQLFGGHEEAASCLYDLFWILSRFIPTTKHPYYPILEECDTILLKVKGIDPSPLSLWKAVKAQELEKYLHEKIAGDLSLPQPVFNVTEQEPFLKDLSPDTKEKYSSYLKDFLEHEFKYETHLTIYLAHLLTLIDDKSCLSCFITKILSTSPNIQHLEDIFKIVGITFSQYPECKQMLKDWILGVTQNQFPTPLIHPSLKTVIEKGCPDYSEEIFYTIDALCIVEINKLVGISGATMQMASFLDSIPPNSFPFSKRGSSEYLKIVDQFNPESWNPVVWLLLRRCGPLKVTQHWRITWLQKYIEQKQPLSMPEEVLKYEGGSEGYFILRNLFGEELLPKALKLFKECCKAKDYEPSLFMPLWQQMRFFLPVDNTFPKLNPREAETYPMYSALVGEFTQLIVPLLEKCTYFQDVLRMKAWEKSLQILTEVIVTNQPGVLKALLGQFEDWLAQLFLRTQRENEVQTLRAIYETASEKIIERLPSAIPVGYMDVRKHLQDFRKKMESFHLNLHELHKFYRAFLSYAYHRPTEDWLLHFKEGWWGQHYAFLSQRIRHTLLTLLNAHLPLYQSPYSCHAWEAAYRLLQGKCEEMQSALAIIEEAIENTKAHQQLALPMSQEQNWRRVLNELLPSSRGQPSYISLTMGFCQLNSIFMETMDAKGECLVEQKKEHSHPVKQIKNKSIDVYFKWKPRSFGLQLVSHYLNRCVLGVDSPCLDLIKVIGKKGFFQLSQTVEGISLEAVLNDRNQIPQFDLRSFSQNFVRMLLEGEWDGKPNNYQAALKDSKYSLCNVDREIVFHPPYTVERNENEIKIKIHLKSVILCLNEMDQKIHEEVARIISEMDIEKTLQQVLILCKQARRRMISCFEEKEEIQLWEQKMDPRYVGIPLQLRYLQHWYMTLWRMQQLFKKDILPSHWEILEIIFPVIADTIRQAHELKTLPKDRFDYLYQKEYNIVSILKDGKPHKTMLTKHSQAVLLNCLTEKVSQPAQPSFVYMDLDKAFTHLSDYHSQSMRILDVRAELKRGKMENFAKQDQIFREQVLWGNNPEERIIWSTFDHQQALLQTIQDFSFQSLYLSNCQSLTRELLLNLLGHSPTLQVLDLTGCKFLDPLLCWEIARKAPFLRELILSQSNLKGIYQPGKLAHGPLSFPCLAKLEANLCNDLADVRIRAPQLRILLLNHNFQISYLDVFASKNCRIGGEGCCLKFAAELQLMSLSHKTPQTSHWETKLSSKGKDGQTSLHGCARYNLIDQAKVILKKGSKPDLYDNNSCTPFLVAAAADHQEMLELLSQYGANISSLDGNNDTPMHLAAKNGSTQAIQWLLGKGIMPGQVNKQFLHAIHLAALYNRANVLPFICKDNADLINARYQELNGQTTLHLAAGAGALEAIDVLLTYGADIELINAWGATALHEAIKHRYIQINNSLPLLELRQVSIIKLLIRKEVVNRHDKAGETPLHLAVKGQQDKFVGALLEGEADCNNKDNNQRTPLHWAAEKGFTECIRLLCDKGANVNETDLDGLTPLHFACMMGRIDAVRMLVEKGADLNPQSKEFENPLQIAEKHQGDPVVEQIKQIFKTRSSTL